MGDIQDRSSFRGPSRAAGGGGCGGRLPLSNWQNTVAATTSHEGSLEDLLRKNDRPKNVTENRRAVSELTALTRSPAHHRAFAGQ